MNKKQKKLKIKKYKAELKARKTNEKMLTSLANILVIVEALDIVEYEDVSDLQYEIVNKYNIDIPVYDSRFNRQYHDMLASYERWDIDTNKKYGDYWYTISSVP